MTRIPKFPQVPPLTDLQIDQLTSIVFLDEAIISPQPADLIFVFGGSHPGCWETAAQAYLQSLAPLILLTGGSKPNVIRHSTWTYGTTAESHVMRDKLIELGIPLQAIRWEEYSTNSIENVIFAKEIVDFQQIQSLIFVCKSFATGRQLRTLQKQLPPHIKLTPYPFDTNLESEKVITRENWMEEEESRSFIYGEYLRMIAYGEKGHMVYLDERI